MMKDLENRKKLEQIIIKLDIEQYKKDILIPAIYRDEYSIPIVGIANELSSLNAKLSDEDRKFIKDLYSKYGW